MNTCAFLTKMARQHGDAPALLHGDESISYHEFHERALAVGGNLLARGLERGDRVAFALHNSPRVMETIYGCFAAGLVVVPVNARLHPREMGYIVGNSDASVLIHSPEFNDGILEHGEAF